MRIECKREADFSSLCVGDFLLMAMGNFILKFPSNMNTMLFLSMIFKNVIRLCMFLIITINAGNAKGKLLLTNLCPHNAGFIFY